MQWSVGDITVTRIESSNFVLPSATPMPAWSVPAFNPSVEQTSIAFSALVVRTPTSTIVVDPWLVDDGPRHLPVAEADAMIAGLLGEVAAVGARAEDVDTVVLSHVDGIGSSTRPTDDGWQPTFPDARYLLPRRSWRPSIAVSRSTAPASRPAARDRLAQPVDSPFEVGAGVTLVDAPGHNFGHVAVRIEQTV